AGWPSAIPSAFWEVAAGYRLFFFPPGGRSFFAAALMAPPHFASISRASSAVSAEVGGYLSFQANGRTASMMALECEVTQASLSSAGMRGSSAELQALRTMSICSVGSQRVV